MMISSLTGFYKSVITKFREWVFEIRSIPDDDNNPKCRSGFAGAPSHPSRDCLRFTIPSLKTPDTAAGKSPALLLRNYLDTDQLWKQQNLKFKGRLGEHRHLSQSINE